MTGEFRVPEQAVLASRARRLAEVGVDKEIVLGVLRKGGMGKMDSIKVLSQVTDTPLLAAMAIVNKSRTWKDTFPRDVEFHARLAEALDALAEDEDEIL